MWSLLPLAWRAGIIALAVVAAAGSIGGCVLKIKHDAVVAERAKVEKEKDDAIDDANKAKGRLRRACDSAPDQCVRDEWFRD